MSIARLWTLVTAAVAGIYALIHFVLPGRIDGMVLAYVVTPALWLLVGLVAFLAARRAGLALVERDHRLLLIALVAALLQILLLALGGLEWGFGRSPYASTLAGMATNAARVFAALLGMEVARVCLVRSAGMAKFLPALVGSSLVLTLAQIQPAVYARLGSAEGVATLGGTVLLPSFAENLLAGLFALLGGVPAAFVYRGTLAAAHWFSPILPDLPWAPAALIGTVVPVLMMHIVAGIYRGRLAAGEAPQERDGSWWSTARTTSLGLLMVVVFWFIAGVFGPRPILIASGSMRPAIEVGDIVVLAPVDADTIEIGDIIAFDHTGTGIPQVHRVIEVRQEGGEIRFVTKGDANDRADREPVPPEVIEGEIRVVIPKIGWLAIGVRNVLASLPSL
ncbi:MAG: signal peptidase I [Clostridiales bacterium]|nr:signal peptidase I [Clostridiales bacterium]